MKLRLFSIRMLLLCALLSIGGTAIAQTTRGAGSPAEGARRAEILRTLSITNTLRSGHLPVRSGAAAAISFAKGSANRVMGGGADAGISGTVNGVDPTAASSIEVVAFSSDTTKANGGDAYFADVKSDGTYLISGLESGSYYVMAFADGYDPLFYRDAVTFDAAITVNVRAGSVTRNIDFNLQATQVAGGSIAGRVVRDGDNTPIADAAIIVVSDDNPCLNLSAKTDANGDYVVEGLPTGSYKVYASAEGYIAEFFDNAARIEDAATVNVTDPDRSGNINFSLGRGGSITGHVTDENGDPLEGIMVQALTDSSFDCFVAVTDSNGDYTISGMPSGSYTVMAIVSNCWFGAALWYDGAQTADQATPVPVRTNQTTSGIDFHFGHIPTTGGSISGIVFDDAGNPVAGAIVMAELGVKDPNSTPFSAFAITEADGSYHIDNLPDGEYLVSAQTQSCWSFALVYWPNATSPDDATLVPVINGASDPAAVNFRLPVTVGTSVISGTVYGNGVPLANASIIALAFSPADSSVLAAGAGFTDSDGNYQITGLPAGSYIVQASYWGTEGFGQEWYKGASDPSLATPVVLADGQTQARIDFNLSVRLTFGSITGKITDYVSGAPVARAYVEVYPVDGDPFTYTPGSAVTDENGDYRIDGLTEGKYMMVVYSDRGFGFYQDTDNPDSATLVGVSGGGTTVANDRLQQQAAGAGVITGRITDQSGAAPDMALVIAMAADGSSYSTAVADVDGSYQVTGLADGDYLVMAYGPSYIGQFYDNAFDPADATPVHVSGGTTGGIDFALVSAGTFQPTNGGGARILQGGAVQGHVTNSQGHPLANATVYMVNGANKAVGSAQTRADGSYEIAGVRPGNDYRFYATRPGYSRRYNDNAPSFVKASPVAITAGSARVDFALSTASSSVNTPAAGTGASISAVSNAPNPFPATTSIGFFLAGQGHVHVSVVNTLGQKVTDLFDGTMSAGQQHVIWNGRDGSGKQVQSGIYFYRIDNGGEARTGTMTLMR